VSRQEAVVEGRPELVLSDEEREALAELLAELVLEAIDTAVKPAPSLNRGRHA
jgi:hypothetical protein